MTRSRSYQTGIPAFVAKGANTEKSKNFKGVQLHKLINIIQLDKR